VALDVKPWFQSDEQVRHQQRTALLGAALIVPFALLDATPAAHALDVAVALAARAFWVASLVVGALLLRHRWLRTATALMAVATVAAPIVSSAAASRRPARLAWATAASRAVRLRRCSRLRSRRSCPEAWIRAVARSASPTWAEMRARRRRVSTAAA